MKENIFKVGDILIATKEANGHYSCTTEGVQVVVVRETTLSTGKIDVVLLEKMPPVYKPKVIKRDGMPEVWYDKSGNRVTKRSNTHNVLSCCFKHTCKNTALVGALSSNNSQLVIL